MTVSTSRAELRPTSEARPLNSTSVRRVAAWPSGWRSGKTKPGAAASPSTYASPDPPRWGGGAFCRAQRKDEAGRRRVAVNLRRADPAAVAQIPIDHFDGLDTFDDL